MTQQQNLRHKHRHRHKQQQHRPRQRSSDQVWIEFDRLPRDLGEDELKALVDSLPKPPRGKAVEASHVELQTMSLQELHETAEKEGVELPQGGKREDLIFEITAQRLNRRQRVLTEGTLETTKENHTFVRLSDYAYLPTTEDVFVPPSVVARYGLLDGHDDQGRAAPAARGRALLRPGRGRADRLPRPRAGGHARRPSRSSCRSTPSSASCSRAPTRTRSRCASST